MTEVILDITRRTISWLLWNTTIILLAALTGKLVDKCSEIKSAACRAYIAKGGRTPMYLTILCNAQYKDMC